MIYKCFRNPSNLFCCVIDWEFLSWIYWNLFRSFSSVITKIHLSTILWIPLMSRTLWLYRLRSTVGYQATLFHINWWLFICSCWLFFLGFRFYFWVSGLVTVWILNIFWIGLEIRLILILVLVRFLLGSLEWVSWRIVVSWLRTAQVDVLLFSLYCFRGLILHLQVTIHFYMKYLWVLFWFFLSLYWLVLLAWSNRRRLICPRKPIFYLYFWFFSISFCLYSI